MSKSLEWPRGRGWANARLLGSTKFANAPTPGTDKAGKCPAVARGGGGGGGWAHLELTDALRTAFYRLELSTAFTDFRVKHCFETG